MGGALGGFCYRRHWDGSDLAVDWYCAPRGTPLSWPEGGTVFYTLQVGPDGPGDPLQTAWLLGDSGYCYSFTHVEEIAAGRKQAWEDFAVVGRSGIARLPGEPDHVHLAIAYHRWPDLTPDGPRGTLPALDCLLRMGFGPEVIEDNAPGPADYEAGRAVAGRWV